MFDILVFILPILAVWTYHEQALTLHLVFFGMIALMAVMHHAMGKSKDYPIFTDWLMPGGSNPHHSIYTIEAIESTFFNLNECRKDKKKTLNEETETK